MTDQHIVTQLDLSSEREAEILEAEHQVYPPSPEVVAQAYINDYDAEYAQSMADLEAFWGARAQELDWFEPWDKILDTSKAPFYQWFTGAKTNIAYNALDRHVKTWRKNKLAFIWEGEDGTQRT